MPDETFGQRLKRLRDVAGLSQPALAEAAGVPVATIRGWEQNRRDPVLPTALRVAEALGCTLDELAGRASVEVATKPPAPTPDDATASKTRKGKK
jgi:transcriptional regulator with XRE-family HTH domain